VSAIDQRGESPLQAEVPEPVVESNCVIEQSNNALEDGVESNWKRKTGPHDKKLDLA
jgi:hypothetical protein